MEQWPGLIQDRSPWFPDSDSTVAWHWRVQWEGSQLTV